MNHLSLSLATSTTVSAIDIAPCSSETDLADVQAVLEEEEQYQLSAVPAKHMSGKPEVNAPIRSDSLNGLCLLEYLTSMEEDDIADTMWDNGYELVREMNETRQGANYEACIRSSSKTSTLGFNQVAIKRVSKALYFKGESRKDEDGFRELVDEDIIKEATILKYMSRVNQSNGYFAKFVDFFQTESDYYLVSQYVGQRTLAQFVDDCQNMIKVNKLSLAAYKKCVKYLMWQICVFVHSLHNDMNICHLDLRLNNIYVCDGTFVQGENGHVTINPQISIKVSDFGLAEVFDASTHKVAGKWCLRDSLSTVAPEVYHEKVFDGMSADSWSLGTILFELLTGKPLYRTPDAEQDSRFRYVEQGKVLRLIHKKKYTKRFDVNSLSLLQSLLETDASLRLNSQATLQCEWFAAYFRKYAKKIEKTSCCLRQALKSQCRKLQSLPYCRTAFE